MREGVGVGEGGGSWGGRLGGMKICYLGVGALSTPMIRNLLAAGHEVVVWNRTRAKAEGLVGDGAVVAETAVEGVAAVSGGGVVVSCLANDEALEAVLGEGAVFETLGAGGRGGLHVSMSTCSPTMMRRLDAVAREHGVTHLTCPVLGRPDFVERRAHRYACSGPREAFERIEPVLNDVSERTFYLGENVESALVAKLCTNFLIASAVASISESLGLARAAGADAEAIREMWNETLFPGVVYTNYSRQILDEAFDPLFTLRLMLKDVSLFGDAAVDRGVDAAYAAALRERFSRGVDEGLGDQDFTAISRLAGGKF